MNRQIYQKLYSIAKQHSHSDDSSHDFSHIQRVLANIEYLAKKEGGDRDILVPASLFHDVINHPKNSSRSLQSADESAAWTEKLLRSIPDYPQVKIAAVSDAIAKCSFTKAIMPELWESKLLQDADLLDSTGAVSIARSFASAGLLKRPLYNEQDPFCQKRKLKGSRFDHGLDIFYGRLLKVQERFHTKTAQRLAKKRHAFLLEFLEQFRQEIEITI